MQTKSASWVSYTPAPASPSVHRQRPPSTWDANRCLHSFMSATNKGGTSSRPPQGPQVPYGELFIDHLKRGDGKNMIQNSNEVQSFAGQDNVLSTSNAELCPACNIVQKA
uniref:Uncharacterized protein n=1 Tax=Setaria viridis TaxID=4556 RepID=A0A4U6VBF1_SETVI|nr:hypothetical protein SEVIR_4G169000v2 [Setaria viridis]